MNLLTNWRSELTAVSCLDLNNLYVNSHNHGWEIDTYLNYIGKNYVKEIHLAGYTENRVNEQAILIDTHNCPVSLPVWDLYTKALPRFGVVPTLIEWDQDIPEWSTLQKEAEKISKILEKWRQPATNSESQVLHLRANSNMAKSGARTGQLQNNFLRIFSGESAADLLPEILETQFSASQRLKIYQNHHLTSLTLALKNIYPVILRLVGENFFEGMARDFIDKELLVSGVLQEFGENFCKFVRDYASAKNLEYLSAVAHFEWSCHQAYYAANDSPLDFDRLKIIVPQDYGKIKFKLHPSHQLCEYRFPVFDIWQMCQQPQTDQTVNLLKGLQRILVIRPELTVNMLILGSGEFALLKGFSQNLEFAEACALALEAEPEFQVELCLKKHIINKHIVDFFM